MCYVSGIYLKAWDIWWHPF